VAVCFSRPKKRRAATQKKVKNLPHFIIFFKVC
jgi:hypothetical protein